MAWILRFVNNCRLSKRLTRVAEKSCLTVPELIAAEKYLVRFSQEAHFTDEIISLKAGKGLSRGSNLLVLHPLVDFDGVLRVGGRECNPVILHGKQVLTRLIIRFEHLRLLHAGPTLVFSLSLFSCY